MKIVALIPARSKSKGIINKNIKLYKGLPLISHSIKIGLESSYINDVYEDIRFPQLLPCFICITNGI
jgi:CMP-N-acetylneuraminic acid synthetase